MATEVVEEVEEAVLELLHPDTREPNILTFQMETGRGARCTSSGARELTFVVSQHLVLGRMSLLQNQTNETGTSSVDQQEKIVK